MWGVMVIVAMVGLLSAVSLAASQTNVLSLDTAIELALANHPSVGTAALSRLSKELAVDRRSAAYSPRLSTSLKPVSLTVRDREAKIKLADSLSFRGDLSSLHGWDFSIANRIQSGDIEKTGLSVEASLKLWPSPRYGADYLSLMEAKESVVIAAKQEADVQATVLVDIYRRYRLLQIDYERLAIQAEEYGAQVAAHNRVLDKAQQGLASPAEALKAEQERAESQATYERALRDHQRELRAFLSDLSLDGDEWQLDQLPGRPMAFSLGLTPEQITSLVLERDTSVYEHKQAVLAARRKAEAVRADNGIQLTLAGNARFLEENASRPGFEAYIGLAYPLMDGGIRQLEVKEAEIAIQQAEKALAAQQSKVCLEVEKKLSDLEWLEAQMHIAEIDQARVGLEQEAKQLQAANGLIPQAEAEASQRSLMQARLDWFEAMVAYEAARLELRALAGESVDVEGGAPLEKAW